MEEEELEGKVQKDPKEMRRTMTDSTDAQIDLRRNIAKLYENIGHASIVMTWEKLWSETNISMQGPGNILLY